MPFAAPVAVDSARTLSDIPEDYLSSPPPRRDEVPVEAGTPPGSPHLDLARVPSLPRPASVTSQSVSESYSEEFSSSAAVRSRPSAQQKSSDTQISGRGLMRGDVSEDGVETENDVSEALSENQLSPGPVRPADETFNISVADRTTSPFNVLADSIDTSFTAGKMSSRNYVVVMVAF